MKTPLFSIVTCTYNRKRYLDECLASLKSQTCKDFEHIIIDGNSNDGTYELLKKYQKESDEYAVKIFRCKPKGVSNAFNEGILKSCGKYVIFLNSDDYLIDKNALNNTKKILAKKPKIDWLQCKSTMHFKHFKLYINSKYLLKPLYFINHSYTCPVSHQSTVLKRSLYIKYGLFDETMFTHMDTDMYYKLRKDIKIHFTDSPLIMFRWHKGSISGNFKITQLFTFLYPILYKKYKNIPLISGLIMTMKYKKNLEYIN